MGCTGCSGWMSRKSLIAADAVGCAGVNTPVVTYCDGPDARVAREGTTTSTRAQAETPATIITRQIRQPIGIRIEGQVLKHFHFSSVQGEGSSSLPEKAARRPLFFCIHQK